jgi:hypothetical protein
MSDLTRLQARYPAIHWDEPIKVSSPGVPGGASVSGYACRICIAMEGLRGDELEQRLESTPGAILEHINHVHK